MLHLVVGKDLANSSSTTNFTILFGIESQIPTSLKGCYLITPLMLLMMVKPKELLC